MSALWLDDEPQAIVKLTCEERQRVERAEVYAWLVTLALVVAFSLGLIIGMAHNAPR